MLLATVALAGCASARPVAEPGSAFLPDRRAAARTPIKHIVIIVQENRSFDTIFHEFPGADTRAYGYWRNKKIVLHPVTFTAPTQAMNDMVHTWETARESWDKGKMDLFGSNCFSSVCPGNVGSWPYAYLQRDLVAPYWQMASTYVLDDHMFPTMFGGSFTAHLDLIASTADLSPTVSETDYPSATPWGCDAPAGTATTLLTVEHAVELNAGPAPCFTQFKTLATVLDARNVSWRYYAPAIRGGDVAGLVWSEFSAIADVRYGPDWANVVSPETTVLTDAAHGTLPAVAWVIPDYADSDHSAANSDEGPSWVAAVVNAIGDGPDWNSTAVFVLWDDWGGWYDHVPPPQLDWKGLGIRTPCMVISPYAKRGFVDHAQYEFASILKFVEQTYGLPPIGPPAFGYTDTRASAMLEDFDFTQHPRLFTNIPAKYPESHFLQRTPSLVPPDDD